VTDPYDFEFPYVPPTCCNRCGALVQKRDVHDEWHNSILTRAEMANVLSGVARRTYEAP
jgi:hypothetical protein